MPSTKTGTLYSIVVASVDVSGVQNLYSQEKSVLAKVDGPPVAISVAHPYDSHGPSAWRLTPPSVFIDPIKIR